MNKELKNQLMMILLLISLWKLIEYVTYQIQYYTGLDELLQYTLMAGILMYYLF